MAAFATCVDVENDPVSARTRHVRDANGNAVTGASVEVRDSVGKMVFVTKSDTNGKVSIKWMSSGN